MINRITHTIVLVKDQDEALRFYVQKLGFEKKQDATIGNFRWLVVAPKQQKEGGLVLIRAETPEEKQAVGNQTGGRYSLFVVITDDCQRTFEELKSKGVEFKGEPMDNPWGIAVQFKDLYGNQFDLLEPRE